LVANKQIHFFASAFIFEGAYHFDVFMGLDDAIVIHIEPLLPHLFAIISVRLLQPLGFYIHF